MESKYRTQLSYNRCLEEKIVELWRRIEILNKKVTSPDVSSCHEVNATLTDRTSAAQGLSSQSSPLSASLASSEGSMASTISEMKNLQVISMRINISLLFILFYRELLIRTTTTNSNYRLPSTHNYTYIHIHTPLKKK